MHRFGTEFNVPRDLVIVAGSECRQVAEAMDSDGIFGSGKPAGSCVTGDLAGSDIEGSLGTNKETVATDHGIGGDGRTLWWESARPRDESENGPDDQGECNVASGSSRSKVIGDPP